MATRGRPRKTTEPTTRKRSSRSAGPGVHAHGCVKCHARYEDACWEMKVNARCYECRTGRPGWQLLIENRLPKQCCRMYSREARKDEMTKYDLSPACAWFMCTECKRTFPYRNPRTQ